MNMAKKFREETGMEWPKPPKTFDDLKLGCPWGYNADGIISPQICRAFHGNDCREKDCGILYWLRKMGEMK